MFWLYTYVFFAGTTVHEQSRADFCKLRFNSKLINQLRAFNHGTGLPGSVIYDSGMFAFELKFPLSTGLLSLVLSPHLPRHVCFIHFWVFAKSYITTSLLWNTNLKTFVTNEHYQSLVIGFDDAYCL